ncbi:hypothetical protein A1O1_05543 [Capronia coronata CBS 617.96]|uniref:DUF3752 domain-containing protein n=1 Tax=Capronia coronata CBS 617.96 TaxID=1182541 RepID=W9Y7V8_9EURO|nr:uncharacterized protein A1O1_05543 [Capronia coronata CBS 617.96]EXJ88613.1 hypothetical protein A1O1_05543 [Capronia coronata CBS 617.96]
MSSVGPQLPPHLQKRKRSDDEADSDGDSNSSSTGPLPPKPQGKEQPSPPSPKRSRVIGPTLPPAPLDERPPSTDDNDDDSSESDDDDGFGPSLPSANDTSANPHLSNSIVGPQIPGSRSTAPAPAKRDEWMTLAPTGGDWSARVDPTKLKNRKFNTIKGAKGPSQVASGGGGGGGDRSWYETPEEKQARLKREVMGIQDSGAGAAAKKAGSGSGSGVEDEVTARRLKEYNAKRGPSLYAAHSATTKGDEDDDPSARAFDREKDIAGGATINATKRREMLKKASDFSSRFSSAKYL